MEITVDIDEVEKFIQDDKFLQFLTNNTTDFTVVAFILSTLLDRIEELKASSE